MKLRLWSTYPWSHTLTSCIPLASYLVLSVATIGDPRKRYVIGLVFGLRIVVYALVLGFGGRFPRQKLTLT